MKTSFEIKFGHKIISSVILLIIHVRFFTDGQSISHLLRPTSTLRSGVIGSFSLPRPPHTQSTSYVIPLSTTTPSATPSSSLFVTSSVLATSSSYLPIPTPTQPAPTISLNISVQIPEYSFDREDVTFLCSVQPEQNATFSWHSSDMIVLSDTANLTTILPGYFTSSSLLYCCQVNNSFYKVAESVCGMAPVVLHISSVLVYPTSQTEHTNTLLLCNALPSNASMNLAISYYWEYVGNSGDVYLIQTSSRYSLSSDNRTLTLTSRSIALSGRYYCSAYFTDHVLTTRNFSAIVQQYASPALHLLYVEPSTTTTANQLLVEIGASLTVKCSGAGYEIPSLSWRVDGVTDPPDTVIQDVSRYNPPAPNGFVTEAGNIVKSLHINRVDYPIRRLECVGINRLSSATVRVDVFVLASPCPPENVRTAELGENWALVEWSNGQTCLFGGQDVSVFTLRLRELSGQVLSTFVSTVASQQSVYRYNITGLDPDYFYQVDVSGENPQGSSNTSSAIILHTLAPSDTNIIMFPFGALPGDSLVPHGSYSQSPAISLGHPVPIGNRVSASLYLSPLGVMSFDRPFHYWDVQQLGVGSLLQDLSLLAPFWSDVDYSSQGSLFYNLYSNSNPAHSQILSNATQLVAQHAGAPSHFNATTLLVATWSRVLPYSAAQTQGLQENSFQLGLVTDQTASFVLFGYKGGDVGWSATEQVSSALIGFSAASLPSEVHPLSLTPEAHTIDSSSDLTIIGYNISYYTDQINTAQSECESWSQSTSMLQVHAPSCPCTLLQARLDAGFYLDRITPEIPNGIECYISLFSLNGPVQRCCFTERLQSVITGGRFRGSALESNPTDSLASYLSGDRKGYMSCCILSDSCEKFYAERISDNCSLYQPPGFVWGFGLSHLITPDGNELTFNGLGEYVLVEGAHPCPVQLQVRTEKYSGTNATFFTALSLSESNCSSLLFVRLNSERSQLKIYFNDTDITESIRIQDTLSVCVAISNRTDAILIRFLSGFSLAVWTQNGVLNFNLSLPRATCYLRTKGLVGEWDGEGANDLLLRNGTLLPYNVSDQGKEPFYHSWRIREDESLMRYDTANFTTYNPTEYEVSIFSSELFSKGVPQEVEDQCSGWSACLFDQLVTGSVSLANSSRDVAIASSTSSQDINSLPPILSVSTTLLVHSGSQFSYSLLPSSSSPQSLILSSFSPLRHTLLTFSEDAYLLQAVLSEDIGEFIITLSARDVTTGLVSEYSPTLFYCSCPLLDQCSFPPPLQADLGSRFYNLSCGCEKGFNITQGHTCTSSPECEIQLDIHFVIDGAGSLGQSEFDEELEFIALLMERFEYPPNTVDNRVGYLVFSSGVDSYHPLSTDFSSVVSSLKSTHFSGGFANHSSPLDYMLRLVYTSKVLTQTLIVYMTDEGQSFSSGNEVDVLMHLSEQLESGRGVRILVIGLGSNVDVSQLLAIATGPGANNFLAFSSLSQAQLNVTDIIQEICQIVTLPTTSSTESTTQTVSTTIRSTPGGSTPSVPPTPSTPPPLPSLYLVTLKFSLSYATLLSITQSNIPEFLSDIVESLGSLVSTGTLSVVGGMVEVSFAADTDKLGRAEVRTKLDENSHLGSLYPYLTEAVITDFSSVATLGLAVYLFYYVVPIITVSLSIFLLYIHFQCGALQRGKRSGGRGTEKKVPKEESEGSSELKDEVASVLEEERPRITRPGIIIPSQSLAVELGTDRTGSESVSNYGMSSVSEIPLFKPRARIMSRPLSAAQISDLLSEDPPYTIHLEFDALSLNAVSEAEMPPGTESKNRYPNILSPPHSRVPLFLKFNQPASDYINANFVRGYNMMSRAYIATQGPMYNTMDDFWRMIWEQRCEVIVMLTELVERGRHKCIHYWPDIELSSPTLSGDLEISPIDKDYKSSYILSRFKIKLSRDSENKEVREVVHFWFKQWPDFGIPETGIPIITLLLDSRTYARNSQSPILMHCSSGIGRTGVFIALDIGMHELEKKGRADVLRTISLMRQDRGGMVQTKDQYLLVYKTLLAYSDFLKKAQQPDAD